MSWKDNIYKKINDGSVDLLSNLELTETTINKRAQINLDKYTTFIWDNLNSFDNFGAFIINSKSEMGVQFYNGPSFSNTYTSPQFDNGVGTLTGVTLKRQTISFTVAVYWISESDYQKFINWLHPYTIANLTFSFNDKWRYVAKLSGIKDSTRSILGYEGSPKTDDKTPSYGNIFNSKNNTISPRYYSEIALTFEIQGTPCLIGNTVNELSGWEQISATQNEVTGLATDLYVNNFKTDYCLPSNLKTPIDFRLHFNLSNENVLNTNTFAIKLRAHYEDSSIQINAPATMSQISYNEDGSVVVAPEHLTLDTVLFDLYLTNLTWNNIQSAFAANNGDVPIGWNNARIQKSFGQSGVTDTTTYETQSGPTGLLAADISEEGSKETVAYSLNIRYDSESGLLFMQYGNSKEKLITTLNTISTGSRIVDAYEVKKFFIPGLFDQPNFKWENLSFILSLDGYNNANLDGSQTLKNSFWNAEIECYSRTNVI